MPELLVVVGVPTHRQQAPCVIKKKLKKEVSLFLFLFIFLMTMKKEAAGNTCMLAPEKRNCFIIFAFVFLLRIIVHVCKMMYVL